jgi:hypothetical protein
MDLLLKATGNMKSVYWNKKFTTAILLAALSSGCTWVKPTPAGEFVRVAYADAVGACTRKGTVKVSLKDKVAGVGRKAEKVATELSVLARNEGATMGGDTVVAESPVSEGSQEFGVYQCKP